MFSVSWASLVADFHKSSKSPKSASLVSSLYLCPTNRSLVPLDRHKYARLTTIVTIFLVCIFFSLFLLWFQLLSKLQQEVLCWKWESVVSFGEGFVSGWQVNWNAFLWGTWEAMRGRIGYIFQLGSCGIWALLIDKYIVLYIYKWLNEHPDHIRRSRYAFCPFVRG